MANYSLGEARGRISIDYDGSWVERAREGVASFKRSAEEAAQSGSDMFKMLGGWKGIGDTTMDVGKKIAIGLTAPAIAAGAALGAMTLGPGLERLVSIDNAQGKLRGLGHDAESVQAIMDNALASVKGTAFGLGDAATVAANAVAAGIKPGADLERTLKLTADAATIAGTSMGDMGSIFNAAAASNKVQMDTIGQLQDHGVPALQLLAAQLGVTAEEAAQMASDGKVDFATFQDAIEKGMGGAALESGKTFEGAMANMKAAMGRFGAELLSGLLPAVQDAFGRIMTAFDKLKPLATQLGAAITPVIMKILDLVARLGEWFANLSPEMQKSIVTAVAVGATVGPAVMAVAKGFQIVGAAIAVAKGIALGYAAASYGVAAASYVSTLATKAGVAVYYAQSAALAVVRGAMAVATAAQWLFNAAMSANPIILIILAIVALVAALIWFFTQTSLGQAIWSNFMKFLQEAWTNIASFFTTVWQGIVSVATTVWGAIMTAIGAVVDWFQAYVWPVIQFVIDLIIAYFMIYYNAVMAVWNGIMAVVGVVVDWFTTYVLPAIQSVINFIVALYTYLWQVAVFVWQSMVDFIVQVVTNVVNWLVSMWNLFLLGWTVIWTTVSDFFTTIWNGIVAFVTPIVNAIANVIQAVFNNVRNFINTVFSAIGSFISSTWNTILSVISSVVSAVWGFISGVWGQIVSFVTTTFNNVKNAIMNPIKDALAFVGTVKDQIVGFFTGAGNWLIDAGKNIIGGFLKGLQDMFGGVKDFFDNLTNMIPQHKGPPARDKILLTENGRLIMQSLYNGLNAEMGDVLGLMSGLNATIPATLTQDVSQNIALRAQTRAGSDKPPINITVEYHAAPNDPIDERALTTMLGHASELVREELS